MSQYKATQKQIDYVKGQITKGKKLNDYGDYECGCSLNPKFLTINKMCYDHKEELESKQ